jgi:hypothetical protein
LSIDLVVRFNRVGQQVPLAGITLQGNPEAEYNGPFEEFALLMQLRATRAGAGRRRIWTKRPLAIYVPGVLVQEWQTGRLESKMAAKRAVHPEVKLDMRRDYLVLYGWIKGLNAVEATRVQVTDGGAEEFLKRTTLFVMDDLEQRGFRVLDMKAEHVVLRILPDGTLLRRRDGSLVYALVDYELLQRLN